MAPGKCRETIVLLTFNHLLEAARIPLERTRLARHKDQRCTGLYVAPAA